VPGPLLHKEKHAQALSPTYVLSDSASAALPVGDVPPRGIPIDPWPGGGDDIYTPGDIEEEPTFADHVVIKDVTTGSVADYGKLEVALVGESTHRAWTRRQIPNVRIDTDEFQRGMRIGTFEHIRLNNGLVGSIFREHLAHRIYRALGYPALRTSFAFMGTNLWGPDIWVPMVLMEVYKLRFCEDNQELLGGTCVNMWDFPADAGTIPLDDSACQIKECDHTRMHQLAEVLAVTEPGPGFKAALADIIDWPRFHQFQCIGWILATGDDAVHAPNNNLILERAEDQKLIWVPYSVDISAGQDWYPDTHLLGNSTIARGCQADPECWADTYATCQDLVDKFDKLDPEKMVDEVVDTLTEHGMMRAGDDERATFLRTWYEERQAFVKSILPNFQYLPDRDGVCPNDLVVCGDGGCGTPEECDTRPCEPTHQWCDATGGCIEKLSVCPTCDEATPLFCPADESCVVDATECSERCENIFGHGYAYCPTDNTCSLPEFCGGGIIPLTQ
jgi:hypothetical protein